MKMLSKLPTGDANGLGPILRQLVEDPEKAHVIVAIVDCKSTTRDTDTGDVEPTIRVLRAEAVTAADKPDAIGMIRAAITKRTGQLVLGQDVDNELKAVLDQ